RVTSRSRGCWRTPCARSGALRDVRIRLEIRRGGEVAFRGDRVIDDEREFFDYFRADVKPPSRSTMSALWRSGAMRSGALFRSGAPHRVESQNAAGAVSLLDDDNVEELLLTNPHRPTCATSTRSDLERNVVTGSELASAVAFPAMASGRA